MKSEKFENWEILCTTVQLKGDLTRLFLSSSLVFSQSSKHLAFYSLHIFYIKHSGAILHTPKTKRLPTWPRQQI